MKIPQSLFEAFPLVLSEILNNQQAPDRVLDFYFKQNRKWGSRDRRFFAEVIYECLRYFRKYWMLSGLGPQMKENKIQIDEFKKVIQCFFKIERPEVVTPYPIQLPDLNQELQLIDSTSYSDYFFNLGSEELGDLWCDVAHQLNQPPPVFLRTNTLKIDRKKLQSLLASEGHETEIVDESTVALRLKTRKSLTGTESFQSGFFEVQDLSSQKVAELVDPQPNEKIVDACAGGGGKTLHLASLSKNKASLLALDVYEAKLKRLLVRAERAQAFSIRVQKIESHQTIQKLENFADALLLDVPCSGSGVIRRHPETKWHFQKEDWIKIQKTQDQILQEYCKIVKPGGRLIYSTCSLFPSENEKKLNQFLSTHSDWSLESKQTLMPTKNSGDGFFMAKLYRALR